MIDELFVLTLAALFALVFGWAFQALPKENWQIMASRPRKKGENGQWEGENLTYYGFFNANAYTLAVVVAFVMMGAIRIPLSGIFIITIAMLAICMPASRLIARVVEKKPFGFTIGGASFVGILAAPWIALSMDLFMGPRMGATVPVMGVMAAVAVAYAFGEGFGRLACISYGCCYGKPLTDCPPLVRKLFRKRGFTFSGKTKKIAYAHGLDGQRMVPIQGITAVLYCASGLLGLYLFLKGFYFTAFFEALLVTQVWRSVSEFLRADYRGGRKISAYQIMSGLAILYALIIVILFPAPPLVDPDIARGLKAVWHPAMILFFQGIWILSFLYTGRSKTTGAFLTFHVMEKRV